MSATMVDTAANVASVDAIRSQLSRARAHAHRVTPSRTSTDPAARRCRARVVSAMDDYLFHHNANTHWRYPTSEETDALIASARQALADFVNGRPDEIVFGQNMTTLTFHLARALGREWGTGDEIVVTELDHHGNVAPWRALEKDRGVTVRTVQMRTDDGRLDWRRPRGGDHAADQAARHRRGVERARHDHRRRARRRSSRARVGARVFVDAVHYAPHKLVDVEALGCDFLGCSAYKFYGPHIGILWGKRAIIESLDAPRLEPAPQESPERLETGTQNHEGIVGAAAAVDFLASLTGGRSRIAPRRAARRSFNALHARGEQLLDETLELALRDRRADAVRAQARHAAHADAVVHPARLHDRRRRHRARQARRVRVERRLLCGNDHRAARRAAARAGARRLQLLHDRGRGRSTDRGRPGTRRS